MLLITTWLQAPFPSTLASRSSLNLSDPTGDHFIRRNYRNMLNRNNLRLQLIRDTYVFNEVELNGHFASTGKYKLSSAWFYLNQLVCLQLLLSGEISAIATPTRIRQNKERRTNDKISMNLHVSFIYPEQNLYQQWGIFLTPFLQKPEENLYRRRTRRLTFLSLWA